LEGNLPKGQLVSGLPFNLLIWNCFKSFLAYLNEQPTLSRLALRIESSER